MQLKHKFNSTKSDGADASQVRSSNWNDTHDLTMDAIGLVGRAAGGAGAAAEIALGANLAFVGGQLVGTVGHKALAFTAAVPFTTDHTYCYKVVDAAIAFTANTVGAAVGAWAFYELVADGVNVPTFAANLVKQANSGSWVNEAGRVNLVAFFCNTSGFTYTITQGGLIVPPDTTAPTVSARVASDSHTIVVTFSEAVTSTTAGWAFSNGSALTVAAIAGSGTNALTFTVSQTLTNGDTVTASYSSGTGNCVDLASTPNALASFSAAAVTNNISGAVPLTFTVGRTTLSNAGTKFTKDGGAGNYAGLARDSLTLAANVPGRIFLRYEADTDTFLAFDTRNTAITYNDNYMASMWVTPGTPGVFGGWVGADSSSFANIASLAVGNLTALYRKPNGQIWFQKSTDNGATWADVVNTGVTSQAKLYVHCGVQNAMSAPRAEGVA